MDYLEINATGNFDAWAPAKLFELGKNQICDSLGQNLLFENEHMLVWEVNLFPGERLPFRKIYRDYYCVYRTEGLVITRSSNGKISMMRFKKGETNFFEFEGKEVIQDLENIAEHPLLIHLLEYRKTIRNTPTISIDLLI